MIKMLLYLCICLRFFPTLVIISSSIDVLISVVIPISKLVTFTTTILASNSRLFDVDDLVQGRSVMENDELKEVDVDDNNSLQWMFDDFELVSMSNV
jgi:hypothetical protein